MITLPWWCHNGCAHVAPPTGHLKRALAEIFPQAFDNKCMYILTQSGANPCLGVGWGGGDGGGWW